MYTHVLHNDILDHDELQIQGYNKLYYIAQLHKLPTDAFLRMYLSLSDA